MKAKLHTKRKFIYSDGAILEMRIWIVPKTSSMPEGFKYSLVYIDREGKRILGYDNAHGQHHRHYREEQKAVEFGSIEELVEKFSREIAEIRRD